MSDLNSANSYRPRLMRSLLGSTALLSGTVIALALALPEAASAQQATPSANGATPLPPISVDTGSGLTAPLSSSTVSGNGLSASRLSTDDTAKMLLGLPGVSVATGGGISSLPVIHGMADDRLKTLLDGVPVSAACPNHMNPVLSYVTPARVGEAEVWAGLSPVSQGGDSIGGTIRIDPKAPVFAQPGQGLLTQGEISSFFRSINSSVTGAADVTMATDTYSFGVNGTAAHARDYSDGKGDVVHATRYENYSGEGVFSVRGADDQLTVRGGVDYSPYEGFVNQPMDMTFNMSQHINARYNHDFDWGNLQSEIYWRQVHHEMNFLYQWGGGPLTINPATGQFLPGMPMLTHGHDLGYSVKAEIPLSNGNTLRIGNEFNRQTLDDWWPATFTTKSMMGPNTFWNINGGERNRLGTYAEWERQWSSQWTSLLGVRNDTVIMDTGNVQGYNTGSGMGQYYGTDAAAFNAMNHSHVDANFDVTALTRYTLSDESTYEAGYAHKTRSPNLYERYSWSSGMMSSGMIGWFGDDNMYVGNNALKPEVANTFSASADWHDAAHKDWGVKVTPYYTYVQNYIDADPISSLNGHRLSMGMPYTVLQFNNHDAEMFGFDISASKAIAHDTGYGDFDVNGNIGWVRGIRLDDNQNLYHMMPINGKVSLVHHLDGWSSAFEVRWVGSKDLVDSTRSEPTTPGFALLNLRTAYTWQNFTVSAGIDNLLNKQYYDPLGGVDIKDLRYDNDRMASPGPVPAPGRSFNVGMTVKF